MDTHTIRLTARQATLAGIQRAIHRELGRTPLARVELRYSTQAREMFSAQQAKLVIARLLREHGHGTAAVSVRPHEGAIDDATGEHVLRLMPAPGTNRRGGPAGAMPWWRRLTARLRRGASDSDPKVEPGLGESVPAIPSREAVRKLREAVQLATSFVETTTGTALVGEDLASAGVAEAQVIVRLPALDRVLEPLVRGDAEAIASMVKAAGFALAEDFRVSYRHLPMPQHAHGTAYASEDDLEVRLVAVAHSTPKGASSGTLTLQPCAHGNDIRSTGTALPVTSDRTAVQVRVLGTTATAFPQPFVVPFEGEPMPWRFDRDALERAGFGRAHPELLTVASNSCPLIVQTDDDGRPQLRAGARLLPGGAPIAMYYRRSDLGPIVGDLAIPPDGVQVVANAPAGVLDARTGRRLPALVIDVRTCPASNDASHS